MKVYVAVIYEDMCIINIKYTNNTLNLLMYNNTVKIYNKNSGISYAGDRLRRMI